MGNETSNLNNHQIVTFFHPQDWMRLSSRQDYQLWKHKYTHQLAEVYRLAQIPDQKDMKIYQFRSKHEEVIKIYFIGQSKGDFFCGGSRQILLLVQHIPLRLTDVEELTQSQGLTILVSALKGFRSIQNQYGTVWPREDLIGLNNQGKTKVWLSKHSQYNSRDQEHANFYFDTALAQSRRIKHLYDIIERKTTGYLLPYQLKLNLLDKNADYEKILVLVEKYAKSNKVSLKDYIRRDILGNSRSSKMRHSQFNIDKQQYPEPKLTRVGSTQQLRNVKKQQTNRIPERKRIYQTQYSKLIGIQNNIQDNNIAQTTIPTANTASTRPKIRFLRPRGPIVPSVQIENKEQTSRGNQTSHLLGDIPNKRKSTIIDKFQLQYSPDQQLLTGKEAARQIQPPVTIYQHKYEDENIQQHRTKQTIERQSFKEGKRQLIKDIISAEVQKIDKEENIPKKKNNHIGIKKIESTEVIAEDNNTDSQNENNIIVQSNTNPIQQQVEDYLDINFMEKSLSKKFCSPTPAEAITPIAVDNHEDDMFNIAKLEEGLVKFEQSQISQRKMRSSQTSGQQGQVQARQNKHEQKQAEERKSKFAVHPFTVSEAIVEQHHYPEQQRLQFFSAASTEIYIGERANTIRPSSNYYSSSYRSNFNSRDHNSSTMDITYDSLKRQTKTRDIEEKYRRHVKDKKSKGHLVSSNELEYKKGSQVSQDNQQRKVTYDELRSVLKI